MESIVAFLESINDSSFAETVRVSVWVFPFIETMHVLAIVLVMGAIARLDLRILGLVSTNRRVTEMSHEMLPWTWIAFAVAAVFGTLMWTSKPIVYFQMAFFDVKLAIIALAGINMLIFEFVVSRDIADWDRARVPPLPARIAAALSLAFWVSVLVCGRMMGFV